MPKLAKNYYYSKNGERKVNCYMVNLPKNVIQEANINDEEQVVIYAEHGRVIIEQKQDYKLPFNDEIMDKLDNLSIR